MCCVGACAYSGNFVGSCWMTPDHPSATEERDLRVLRERERVTSYYVHLLLLPSPAALTRLRRPPGLIPRNPEFRRRQASFFSLPIVYTR